MECMGQVYSMCCEWNEQFKMEILGVAVWRGLRDYMAGLPW